MSCTATKQSQAALPLPPPRHGERSEAIHLPNAKDDEKASGNPRLDITLNLAGRICALLGLALLLGGMVFFGAVVAPLVFLKLPIAIGGPFIRAIFPWYFAFVAAGAALAAAGFLLRRQKIPAFILAAVLLEALWAWLWLMPHMDAWRAAGDTTAFSRGHALSTWLNAAEILAALALLLRTAI
jgi:hypothetical protein